jgi:hypothetical protein
VRSWRGAELIVLGTARYGVAAGLGATLGLILLA